MSELIRSTPQSRLPVPSPKVEINIRPGTMDDIEFMDELQKRYSKNLAFLPRKALEGKIVRNEVLIAEGRGERGQGSGNTESSSLTPEPYPLTPLGYLIGQDQYFKRNDVGIIYHLAVAPDRQRSFVGAALLKAQFERSSYACRLYCCWCAQDIQASKFYESMGFVPLAFRAGSEKKQRIHIFWEKRIRAGDVTTPWWFPYETKGGLMQADRLAFPIPPGKHWTEEMPMILPKDTVNRQVGESASRDNTSLRLTDSTTRRKPKTQPVIPLKHRPSCPSFAPVEVPKAKKEKLPKEKKPKIKNDPTIVAAARELNARYLEKINENPMCLESSGKYDLTKSINAPHTVASGPHPNPLPEYRARGQEKLLEAA